MKIWMYWENKPGHSRPPYIDLCLETIQRHCGRYEIILLNEESVKEYIRLPNIVVRFKEIAHKADFIRFHLLYKYGGVWLDSDVILLRNIEEAVEPFTKRYDFIGYGREPGKPSLSFMACHRGCNLMKIQTRMMRPVLLKHLVRKFPFRQVELGWKEIGYDILWRYANGYTYHHYDRRMFAPTVWSDWRVFCKSGVPVGEYLAHNPFAVVLYNKMMYERFGKLSADEILGGQSLISGLFKRGLNLV